MEQLGDNSSKTLKDYVDRYERLAEERDALQEDQKELFKGLKAKGLPVKGIKQVLKEQQKDQDKLQEVREEIANAGELLGVPVYVAEHKPNPDDQYPKDTCEFVQQQVRQILRIGEEIDNVSEDMKQLLKDAKDEGFVASLIPKLVKIRKDPDKYIESNLILQTYAKALGIGVTPPAAEAA